MTSVYHDYYHKYVICWIDNGKFGWDGVEDTCVEDAISKILIANQIKENSIQHVFKNGKEMHQETITTKVWKD